MLKQIGCYSVILLGVAIISCAPMAGTSKLVYRSLPEKPRWIKIIPQSGSYEYFVGISDNKEHLEEAKRAAFCDALTDALSRKGIEVTVNYEKLTTEEKDDLLDKVNLAGAAKIGLEQVAWYNEEWEYFYRDVINKKHRAFVLTRSRKLARDGIIKRTFINLGERMDGCWHSMLIPGWGQFSYGKNGKGRLFLFAEMGALVGLGYSVYQYEKVETDYRELKWQHENAQDISQQRELSHDLELKDEELEDLKRYKKYFTYASLGIYGLNIMDALLFGPPSQDKFSSWQLNKSMLLSARFNIGGPSICFYWKL